VFLGSYHRTFLTTANNGQQCSSSNRFHAIADLFIALWLQADDVLTLQPIRYTAVRAMMSRFWSGNFRTLSRGDI